LVEQVWWKEFGTRCGPTWVDSIWDAIYRQCQARNFIGVVIQPVSSSLKWLKSALKFGVPIWVLYPSPSFYYSSIDKSVMEAWRPTKDQVIKNQLAAISKHAKSTAPPLSDLSMDLFPEPRLDPTLKPPTDLPPHVAPPKILPENACWYESWAEFFQKRELRDSGRLEAASEDEKQVWGSRAQHAKSFRCPGRGSKAKVYVWESCDSGGFFRTLQTYFEFTRDWDSYYNQGLVFNAQQNTWDYCPFMWEPAVEDGPPDDLDDDDDLHVMEHWYTEPDLLINLPEDNPAPLDFLYRRYGFLAIEPTTPPNPILPFDKASAYRIVGLEMSSPENFPEHLNAFLTDVVQRKLPAGHCDLSSTSPPNEMFPSSGRTLIYETMSSSEFPQLSEGVVFTFINTPNDPQLLVVHDPLSVLEVVRMGSPTQLKAWLQYLLLNGSRFTLLYPKTRPLVPQNFSILIFPIRNETWKPNAEDFRAYMSRLKNFFHERPYMVAAAFSRGGIAWRIAREVLGTEESINTLLSAYPDECCSVSIRQGKYWTHMPSEGEWFYLVGGYEVLTGL
jgi:hypothetical protein